MFVNGRHEATVKAAAAALASQTGARVTGVAADITSEAGRAALVAACPDADILVNNNEGPTPGKFEDWAREDYLRAFESNMLAPVLMIALFTVGTNLMADGVAQLADRGDRS